MLLMHRGVKTNRNSINNQRRKMRYLILLLITITFIGCDNLFNLGSDSTGQYQEEKACRDTETGQFVNTELCN